MVDIKFIHGDCLEEMPKLADKSIDMILCDLPYGTTACKWDTVIPFEPLWAQYKRIIKDNGAIVLTASQPFTSALVMSNSAMFKYCWYWKKERGTGFALSGKRPLMIVEDVCVFYAKQCTYNPQRKKLDKPYTHVLPIKKGVFEGEVSMTKSVIDGQRIYTTRTHDTPHQLLEFSRDGACISNFHPTQKPVALFEYLIRTYTNEGDTVLDNCSGSGTTGIAAFNTKRNAILIEKDEIYFNAAKERFDRETRQVAMW